MPTLDLITRFVGVDAGAAKGYATVADSARLAAGGVSNYTEASTRATAATKIAADAAVRASDLRIQASAMLRESQRLEASGDLEAAKAAETQAEALSLQAKAARTSSLELNASASAATRQAAAMEESKGATLTSSMGLKGLIGHATGLTSAMESIPTPITIVAGALGKLGVVAGVTGVAVAAISLDLATKYQSALTRLETGAGESAGGLTVVTAALLKQSRVLGVGATQLAAAMYPIESAGFHGAAGVTILHDAVQGALADGADYTTVADAVTSALNSYSMKASAAAGVTNEMVRAVAEGKTTMQDLASSIGTVIPEAAALKIPFAEVLGAISEMTSQGTNASRAATSLRYALKSIADPTTAATGALALLGLKAGTLGDTMTRHGVVAAFTQLEDAVGKKFPKGSHQYLAALANVVGGTRGLTSVLELTGKHMGDFASKTNNVAGALNSSKSGIQGWSDYTKTFKFNLDDAKAGLEELAISLGTKLLPAATKAMHWIATTGVDDLQKFGNWFERNKGSISTFAAYLIRSFGAMADAILIFAGAAIGGMDAAFGWVPGLGGKLDRARSTFDKFALGFNHDINALANSVYAAGHSAGSNLGQGMVIGINSKSAAVRAAAAHMTSQAISEANRAAWNSSPSRKMMQTGRWLAEGLIIGWTGEASKLKSALSTGVQDALDHLQKVLDSRLTAVENRLKASQSKLTSFLSARKSAIAGLQGSIAGGADLSNLFGTDANGNATTANIGSYLTSEIGPLTTFANDLKWGRSHGLSQVLLSQIAGLGAVQGDAVLKQFMSGQANVKQADAAEATIQRAARAAASIVVESPAERKQLTELKFGVAFARVGVELQRELNRKIERLIAHNVARNVHVTITSSGALKITSEDAQTIIKAVNKEIAHGTVTIRR